MKDIPTAIIAGLILACAAAPLPAADLAPEDKSALVRWAEQDYLFGDWGGLRRDLSRRGIDLELFYAGSLPDNLSGGLRTGTAYQGGLLMALNLDAQKLAGPEGGMFQVSGLWLHGQKPFSAQYVGDLNRVNLLDFDDMARLWECWYQQKLAGDLVSLKLGKLSIDNDFIVPELYGSLGESPLVNQTFFFPTLPFDLFAIKGLPPHDHGLPATPYSSPGAVLRVTPDPRAYAQAGVYSGRPDTSANGTRLDFAGREGALAFFELGLRLNSGTNTPGREGSFKLGGYYHTAQFSDMRDGIRWAFLRQAGLPVPPVERHRGNFGGYLLAERQLFSERGRTDPAGQGMLGFFRLLGAPADRNLAQWEVDGGLVYRGLLPTRDWDTVAFAVSYLSISDEIRRAQREMNRLAPGTFTPADYELVFEWSYKIQATAWWTLQPSLQRVVHPGGSRGIPDATVFILQTTLRF
jgi:porin